MSHLPYPHAWSESKREREGGITVLQTALAILLWFALVALASLLAFGIHEHEHEHEQAQEGRRLEAAHRAGMVVGAALCRPPGDL